MSRASKAAQAERRRTQVALLLLAGHTGGEIATAMRVSPATISRDIKKLRQEWRQERVEQIDTMMAEDLERTQAAIRALWPSVTAGDPIAIEKLTKLIALRANILQYRPPQDSEAGDQVTIRYFEVVKNYDRPRDDDDSSPAGEPAETA